MSTIRPLVGVKNFDPEQKEDDFVKMPSVFKSPLRLDIVQFVHTNMAKNHRQPYAVHWLAGMNHSAESWGTGRAVARVPRVSGGGTHRSGQGAFANMCRKGRLAHPTKTFRRWHRKINTNQRRFAVCSALAASAIPSLIMARGHRIENVPEIPLVINDKLEDLKLTKQAIAALKHVGAYEDLEKVRDSIKVRTGKGKWRNRRHVHRRGPLIVYGKNDLETSLVKAFRNIPGIECCHIDRLNLLQLAPGGHIGRFIIWTKNAFEQLETIYGSNSRFSSVKKGYRIPYAQMQNADIARIINSDEIQSTLRPKTTNIVLPKKSNPLKNPNVMQKLNPAFKKIKSMYKNKMEQDKQKKRKAPPKEEEKKEPKKAK